jgi:hypothetical protein
MRCHVERTLCAMARFAADGIMRRLSLLAQASFPCSLAPERDHNVLTDADPPARVTGKRPPRSLEEEADRAKRARMWLIAY